MTLIELLVSLGVLALICVAFATIMAQTQRVVNSSNALMQSNATAAAIAQTLRDDLACFSSQGFLAVYTDPNGGSHLIFTAVRPFTSLTPPTIKANAARIDYGWTDSGTPTDPNDDLLWRRAILLTGTGPGSADPDPNDDEDPNVWLGRYGPNPLGPIDVTSEVPNYCQAPSIPTKVTPSNLDELWPLLARSVSAFRVSCWVNNAWLEPNASTAPMTTLPPAIRVNFTLKTGPKVDDKLDYEVICPLRM